MTKKYYCTLDTETFGGASKPKGIYHLGGIIHDREGNITACFNYVIAEHFDQINKDSYAKKNFDRYNQLVQTGTVTVIDTESHAVQMVDSLLSFYNVRYLMAFNSGFDFVKTSCRDLLEGREFIDIWLMALETIANKKKFIRYCHENNFTSSTKKSISTNAQTFYGFLTGNPDYTEEHTALEDAKIELQIFLACLKCHKKFTKNTHTWDKDAVWSLIPKW